MEVVGWKWQVLKWWRQSVYLIICNNDLVFCENTKVLQFGELKHLDKLTNVFHYEQIYDIVVKQKKETISIISPNRINVHYFRPATATYLKLFNYIWRRFPIKWKSTGVSFIHSWVWRWWMMFSKKSFIIIWVLRTLKRCVVRRMIALKFLPIRTPMIKPLYFYFEKLEKNI